MANDKTKAMTITDYIRETALKFDIRDDIRMMITYAYYIGREDACREVSDAYTAKLAEIKQRADACRYYRMAQAAAGDTSYIYFSDYSGEIGLDLGCDPVPDSILASAGDVQQA